MFAFAICGFFLLVIPAISFGLALVSGYFKDEDSSPDHRKHL